MLLKIGDFLVPIIYIFGPLVSSCLPVFISLFSVSFPAFAFFCAIINFALLRLISFLPLQQLVARLIYDRLCRQPKRGVVDAAAHAALDILHADTLHTEKRHRFLCLLLRSQE
jgi:hypothetical protein